MQFYLATSFIFPRSLRLRLFALCFVATHLPLLAYLGWSLAWGQIALSEFIAITAATVVGMGIALVGIGALLSPIHALAEALHRDEDGPVALPEMGDVIQTLYAGVQQAADTTRRRLESLNQAAHEDALTGIANRRGFLAELDALPDDRRRGCVAIVDIDYFKRVNDLMGHEQGDRVLTAFAARIAGQVRRADILARWGGEEFAIFFRDCMEDEASWSLARIANGLRDDPIGEIQGRPISFSAGIARWQGQALQEALARADEALYTAKQSGRDRICRAGQTVTEI